VVIGGVGGSGTRLIATFLRELNYYIGDDLNFANDNLWFTLLFLRPKWFMAASDKDICKGLHLFEKVMTGRPNLALGEARFLCQAAVEMGFSDYLHLATHEGSSPTKRVASKWPLRRITILYWSAMRVISMARCQGCRPSVHVGWGWKEPNSHIYLRHLAESFSDLKYIHVLRHGLDMAYSSNQAQADNWGSLFGVSMPDTPDLLPGASLAYWLEANEAAVTLGKELLGDRFLAINFDGLCLAPSEQIERLVRFLEISERAIDTDRLCSLCSTPRSVGRYRQHDLSGFDDGAIERVRELGFRVDQRT
jgi:hypothetical protein